jgi:hypothetical protein
MQHHRKRTVHGCPSGLRSISKCISIESIRFVKGRSGRAFDVASIVAAIELGGSLI